MQNGLKTFDTRAIEQASARAIKTLAGEIGGGLPKGFAKWAKNSAEVKSLDLEAWGGLEGFLQQTSNGAGGTAKPQLLKRVLPWLAKAEGMTANEITNIPFQILNEDGSVFDDSTKWENKLGGIPSPQKMIWKVAASLCMGKAYLIPRAAESQIIDIWYCAPQSVVPMITTGGLKWFARGSDWGDWGIYYPADKDPGAGMDDPDQQERAQAQFRGEMIYFWLPDPDVEIGQARTYPMGEALLSSELLTGIDSTLNTYADRNFIPPTIITTEGYPPDLKTMEGWWNRFLRGWTQQVAKIFQAGKVIATKIGAGLEALGGSVYKDLNHQAIENIGAAFGIPAAIFMSDAAFASEVDPMLRFWYTSSVFVAIYKCIEDTLNEQLFARFGKHIQFMPELLPIFKMDITPRVVAYRDLISTRMRPSIAAQISGLPMPNEMELAKLDEDYDKPAVDKPVAPLNDPSLPASETPVQSSFGKSLTSSQIKDLDLWRQIALRNFRKGKPAPVDFECKSLADGMTDPIRARLAEAKSEDDISAAFEIGAPMSDMAALTAELKAARELLERTI
jgi:hypothetical protein